MKCKKPNCGGTMLVEQQLDAQTSRVRCSKCNLTEVRNDQGQRLLTDSGAGAPRGKTLLG